ncbi:MAG TPA: hypothetical protein VMD59_18650 [Acidimicrobiales bacterium]|nr:hypothetical protein [Acidimicrobiales bacterium]
MALRRRRAVECRLEPDRALASLDEAAAFLADRGLLTIIPDSSLPSLFEACHEQPYLPGGRGFAAWPRTRWSWSGELARRPGVVVLKIHRGKNLLISPRVLALVDPICRAELARMESETARDKPTRDLVRLLGHLAAVGPSSLESLQAELELSARELRAIRSPAQRCGVVVARQVVTDGADPEGHVHSSELARFDQIVPDSQARRDPTLALEDLVVAGVTAAVLAEERELRRWFSWSWYLSGSLLEGLLAGGRLVRPADGYVAAGPGAGVGAGAGAGAGAGGGGGP